MASGKVIPSPTPRSRHSASARSRLSVVDVLTSLQTGLINGGLHVAAGGRRACSGTRA
ncbi:MAG: hypothetical protein MZV64_49025 [Ignavibacteriales bacterium]|nr:hypothetical protein [Ignavibacteriales bacterium]